MKLAKITLLLCAAIPAVLPLSAQTWDTSGNAMLTGTYYFRQVGYVANSFGGAANAGAIFGNITFDGAGKYTITNAGYIDYNNSGTRSLSGTYSIAASGHGFMSSPLNSGDVIHGSVSGNIFIGSSTEGSLNDLFIAAPLSAPAPTVASFQGTYAMAAYFPNQDPFSVADASFLLTPDGNGNLGTVSIGGYTGGNDAITQTNSNMKYTFSNGAGVIAFPNVAANFFAGNEYMYISPDGNFVFGGSPNRFDIVVGVRTSPSVNFGGLYYEAGLFHDMSTLFDQGFGSLSNFWGSLNATGGNIIAHQSLLNVHSGANRIGSTFYDAYPSATEASYTSSISAAKYTVGAGGNIRIGVGLPPYLGITVDLKAPAFSGPGVYLDPTGFTNAASYAPFTAGISPGEFITLFGSGLTDGGTYISGAFPTTLGGVQLKINGVAAPLYYATPNQMSAVVPFGTILSIAEIQVVNNGVESNKVSTFVNATTPGVFTVGADGISEGAITHVNGSLVTEASPAKPGETIVIYLTGLGAVFPFVNDGQPGPVSPLSITSNIKVYIGRRPATIGYQGLAPTLVGLYQINATVPAGLTAGDVGIDIQGPDSYSSEALVQIGN